MIPTEDKRLNAHLINTHNILSGDGSVSCKWTNEQGKLCGSSISRRNYRIHLLEYHLRALAGQCEICHRTMANSSSMKRHLKQCLRGYTVEEMWQIFGVKIVRLDDKRAAVVQDNVYIYRHPGPQIMG